MARPIVRFLILLMALTAFGLHAEEPNALVTVAVASLRSAPRHSAELETQATFGTPALIDSTTTDGDWYRATLPDGYRAWIPVSSVVIIDADEMRNWRKAHRLICTSAFETHIYERPDSASPPVSDLTLGGIVEGVPGEEWSKVTLPDRRRGYVATSSVAPFAEYIKRPISSNRIIEICEKLNGSAYLWGGRATKGVDCSGLTQMTYFDSGVMLPRNASAQALIGRSINVDMDSLVRGDLLFFANDEGRVTHVAIYDHDSCYWHSSGRVHRSSMLPGHQLYNGRVVTSARRIDECNGAKRVSAHSWYF